MWRSLRKIVPDLHVGRAGSPVLYRLIEIAAGNLLGRRPLGKLSDENIQDLAGSGLLTDAVSYEFARRGKDYVR